VALEGEDQSLASQRRLHVLAITGVPIFVRGNGDLQKKEETGF